MNEHHQNAYGRMPSPNIIEDGGKNVKPIPGASLEVVPGCGHMLPFEKLPSSWRR